MEKYVIGIDMGGTNTELGLVSKDGKVVARNAIKTQQYKEISAYVNALANAMQPLFLQAGGKENIVGIGAGVPNGNFYKGTIENAPNLPWKGVVPFAELVSKQTQLSCTLTNDANAAAQGEMTYGVARGMKHFIMITLGTGVGSGIVIDGKVVYGNDGFAGELGHTVAVRSADARVCGCGGKGHLEAYCSANGLARTAQEWVREKRKPSLLDAMKVDEITAKDVSIAAQKSDELSKEIFDYTGRLLGEKLADFITFSAPEAIILFGGLARSGELILRPTKEAMEANVMGQWKGKVKLLFSGLNEADAAILGASSLAWNN